MQTHKRNYPEPLMAVLVNNATISGLRNLVQKPRIQLMVEANKEVNNILYYFSLSQVRLRERKICGYYWHRQYRRWLRQDFPLPDILYIRGGVDNGYSQTYTELCNRVRKNGIIITHYRFNKWRLYQIMNRDPAMRKYLPVTRTIRHSDDIKKMLYEYKIVYLKSHFGRKGEDVLRVELLPNGSYRYSYFKNALLTVHTVFGFQALLDIIKSFFNGKNFIIQQGIRLKNYHNRLVDMRAEVQRNGNGDLEVAGISVRFGRPGSPITTHGEAFRFDDFFIKKMSYPEKKMEAFRSAVYEFLYSVYEYLEQNYGQYAEIGIDFAIDTDDKIWFIEANSQSTKVSLRKAYGKPALFKNYKNILEYARYAFKQAHEGQ